MNLETLLTHPEGFGLTTATPLQRAICRASTGVPLAELASHPSVLQAFGGSDAVASLPLEPPKLFDTIAAVRSAKSLIEAAKAYRWSQVVDVSRLGAGEIPRIPIVSFRMDQAQQVFDHLLGAMLRSKRLGSVLIGKAGRSSMFLRHPSGRPIEVRVVAGSRAGTTLVARWLAGCIFDEAPRLQGQEDGIINLDDALSAIQARMLPLAQIDCAGSPWAPRGTVFNHYVTRFGRPGADFVMVMAPGPAMNPGRFTPEFCAELEQRDPRAYKTDVLAQFADVEDSLLSSVDVTACTREGPAELPYRAGNSYTAAIDPATRGNGWTLTIVTSDKRDHYSVVLARQWVGSHSRPLNVLSVMREIGELLSAYQLTSVYSDQHSFDALDAIAGPLGFSLIEFVLSQASWRQIAENLRYLTSKRQLDLPPNPVLRADLLGMQRKLTALSWTVSLADSSGDGRHSDYAPALAIALLNAPEPPNTYEAPERDDEADFCAMMRERSRDPMEAAGSMFTGAPWS